LKINDDFTDNAFKNLKEQYIRNLKKRNLNLEFFFFQYSNSIPHLKGLHPLRFYKFESIYLIDIFEYQHSLDNIESIQ